MANRERQGVWRQLQLKTISQYYRSESAARALSVDDLDLIGSPRWIHVTGITPALSPSCLELVEAIVERRSGHRGGSAFDVNHRPALWPDTSTAARVLLSLSRQADVVFIGDDEAASLYGTSEVQVLASLILRRDDQELVLKRGAGPASVVTHRGEISVPALPAEVVATTGAGDSFAAGYPPRPCSDGLHRIDCGWAFSWRHES
ncbi:MAG: hypothetical protein GY720_14490 [bacterium]|nr:hypothetical protein [bacterium]